MLIKQAPALEQVLPWPADQHHWRHFMKRGSRLSLFLDWWIRHLFCSPGQVWPIGTETESRPSKPAKTWDQPVNGLFPTSEHRWWHQSHKDISCYSFSWCPKGLRRPRLSIKLISDNSACLGLKQFRAHIYNSFNQRPHFPSQRYF